MVKILNRKILGRNFISRYKDIDHKLKVVDDLNGFNVFYKTEQLKVKILEDIECNSFEEFIKTIKNLARIEEKIYSLYHVGRGDIQYPFDYKNSVSITYKKTLNLKLVLNCIKK